MPSHLRGRWRGDSRHSLQWGRGYERGVRVERVEWQCGEMMLGDKLLQALLGGLELGPQVSALTGILQREHFLDLLQPPAQIRDLVVLAAAHPLRAPECAEGLDGKVKLRLQTQGGLVVGGGGVQVVLGGKHIGQRKVADGCVLDRGLQRHAGEKRRVCGVSASALGGLHTEDALKVAETS